jgi:hypothetical protein
LNIEKKKGKRNELSRTFFATTNKLVRLVALEALKNIIIETPVDTGRARSNWFIGIDTPIDDITDETNWQGNSADQQAKLLQPTDKSEIWLSNNLPYIVRLNDGWSDQAPAGFVEKGVAAAEKSIGRVVDKILFEGLK